MQITIRRAEVADAAVLADLGKRTFYDTFTGTCTEADMQGFLQENFNQQQITGELENAGDLYFLAVINGIAAGYIRMMEDYTNFPLMKQWKALELKRIYVDQAFHGKGVAQALMHFAEQYAKEHQYQVLWLGVWEHNRRAKRFYEKCGFADSGHMHDFPIGSTPQRDNWLWKFFV